MIQPIRFAAEVMFNRHNGYLICYREKDHSQVMISIRLKQVIDQKAWDQLQTQDLEEIRSLRELGFIVDDEPPREDARREQANN